MNCVKKKVKVLVAQSCLTVCNPMDCSLPDSSVHGILQARILEWVAIPSSRWSSQLRDWTQVSYFTGRFFIIWAIREPSELCSIACAHWSLRKAFLSLLAILWNSAFKWVCLPFLICLSLIFFSQLFVRPPQTIILPFAFLFCGPLEKGMASHFSILATSS